MTTDWMALLEVELSKARNKSSWNERLAHWGRPASDTEEQKIERAARMVKFIVSKNEWLASQGVSVHPQGSYFNNTNVRLEADMDIRIVHPDIKTEYIGGATAAAVDGQLGYFYTGRLFADVISQMRSALETDLVARFGGSGVDASGNKAIRVHALDGSRADCDIVPAVRLHLIDGSLGTPTVTEGVAILGREGRWTLNFPNQHHSNGKYKRSDTKHRFKKNVRILKKLNYELAEIGYITRRMPSFFIECLVYCVEDQYFLYAEDHHSRIIRILERLEELLSIPRWCTNATEVNGIKFLFREGQAWTIDDAVTFIKLALLRLRER